MVTIVIPTRNRSLFLQRLLSYYQQQHLQEPILIADSSDEDQRTRVLRAVEATGRDLNIEYQSYDSEIGFAEKVSDILMRVRTELAVLGADDDFFTLRGMRLAAEFLQRHADFSVAHGRAVTFELNPGPVYGKHLAVANYLQRSIEHPTAAERLLDHLSHYSTTWYSVHRTQDLRQNLRAVAELQMEPVSFTELLPSCLSLIQGKAKKLEVLYAVRQVHTRKNSVTPDVFDWIANPSWALQLSRFRQRLAEELERRDKISFNAAQEIVKQAVWSYLAERLRHKWHGRYARDYASERVRLKKVVAQRAPGLVTAWQLGRSLLPGEHNQMLLPSLLRPSSPYHTDFMPVYRAVASCTVDTP